MWFSLTFTCNVFKVHSFLWLTNIPLYGYATFCLSIHLLMDIWIISTLGYYKKCCYEHSCTSFYVDICFHFSWMYTLEWNCWSYGKFWAIINGVAVSLLVDIWFHSLMCIISLPCLTSFRNGITD